MQRKMNPRYAGRRTAADAGYKIGGVKVARRHLRVWRVPHPNPPPPASGRGGRPHLLRYRLKEQPAVSSSYHHATLLASFPTQPATRRTALPLPLAVEGWGGGWLAPMAVTPPSCGAAPARRR